MRRTAVVTRSAYAFVMHRLLLLLWLLVLGPTAATALAQLTGDDLGARISYRVDHDATMSIEQVARGADFTPLPGTFLNPGYTRAAYWLRIAPRQGEWIIEVGSALLDHVDLYVPDGKGGHMVMKDGDSLSFGQNSFHRRFPVFVVPAGIGEPVFLRIQSEGPMAMPLMIASPDEFNAHANIDEFKHGIYYGIMVIMVAYNLFLYLVVRDRNYLNYVFYIGTYILFQAGMNGYGHQYLWPDSPWMANHAQAFLLGGVVFVAARFARDFLDIARTAPAFLLPIRAVQWASTGIMIFSLVGPLYWSAKLANYLGLVLVLVLMPASIACARRGYRPAYWFLTAWSLFLVGIFTTGLSLAGLISYHPFTANAMQLGAALEVLLLSLALADRIVTLRNEKDAAQAEAYRHLRQLNEGLEDLVRQRTAEITAINHQLEESNRILAENARHDGLTGLLNHASFMADLTARVDEGRRYHFPLALLMVDIDYFKKINDTYGHQVGDIALKAVARHLKEGKRTSDTAARYGGEEFTLLLPHTPIEGARDVAERLRRAIEMTRVEEIPELRVSASFGVAVITSIDKATSASQLIKRADEALYQAKREGRNRVCIAPPVQAATTTPIDTQDRG